MKRATLLVSPGLGASAIATAIWYRDYSEVAEPVASALEKDPRNSGYELSGHYSGHFDSSTLVLDLRRADHAAPLDLLRGVFATAEAMKREHRRFEKIILARAGEPVFEIDGTDFSLLGDEVAAGENPVYLVRTFPEKLKRPNGTHAFGTWTGGLLGVASRQIEEVNTAAGEWARDR
jgi:hypothetical protein